MISFLFLFLFLFFLFLLFFIFYFLFLFLFFHIFHLIFFFKQYKNCENFILNFLIIFITTFNFKNLKRDKFIEKQLNYIKN